MGKAEILYIETLDEEIKKKTDKFFSFPIPALIVANEMEVDDLIIYYAKNIKDLFLNLMRTDKLVNIMINFLEEKLAEETTLHGVCLEVFGLGIIKGKAVGKSETARS